MGNQCCADAAIVQQGKEMEAVEGKELEAVTVEEPLLAQEAKMKEKATAAHIDENLEAKEEEATVEQEVDGAAVVSEPKEKVVSVEGADAVESGPDELKVVSEAAQEEPEEATKQKGEEVTTTGEINSDKQAKAEYKLVMVFELAGKEKTVEFTNKELGFECSQGTCCAPRKGPVKVTKVVAKQQAAALGVPRGAKVLRINGKDISDAIQFRDLLQDALSMFSGVVFTPSPGSEPKAVVEVAAGAGVPSPGTPTPAPDAAPEPVAEPASEPAEANDAVSMHVAQATPPAAQEAMSKVA